MWVPEHVESVFARVHGLPCIGGLPITKNTVGLKEHLIGSQRGAP